MSALQVVALAAMPHTGFIFCYHGSQVRGSQVCWGDVVPLELDDPGAAHRLIFARPCSPQQGSWKPSPGGIAEY